LPIVAKTLSYQRYVELELTESTDPDELLQALVGRVSIKRFEVKAPSLHSIFVSLVGGNGGNEVAV
jgi:ABC-type uncharacterized transport system ATPase subunit